MKLFIDAAPICTDKISGIGHTVLHLVKELDKSAPKDITIILLVPLLKHGVINRYGFSERVSLKTVPLPARVVNKLNRMRLLPKMDLLFGRGSYLFGNFTNWPLTKGSKSFTYVHDVAYARHPEFIHPLNLRMLREFLPSWVQRTNTVITVSEFSKREIEHVFGLEEDKVRVVFNGIDHDEFSPRSPDEVSSVKKTYEIDGDYFIFLSNLEPRKNIQKMIEAFMLLPTEIQRSHSLVMVGADGWNNEDILHSIERAKEAGIRIIRPDRYVPDEHLPALLSGATGLIHVALYEGFGLSPLQAMACGTPVIVSNTTSLPEVVGNGGLQVDPLDVPAIAGAISKIATDHQLASKLSQQGKQQAALFTWAHSVDKLVAILRRTT